MVLIYGKPNCIYCDMAKKFLDTKKIEYHYEDITVSDEAMTYFKQGGYKSVPQIWRDGVHVGGFENLVQEKF